MTKTLRLRPACLALGAMTFMALAASPAAGKQKTLKDANWVAIDPASRALVVGAVGASKARIQRVIGLVATPRYPSGGIGGLVSQELTEARTQFLDAIGAAKKLAAENAGGSSRTKQGLRDLEDLAQAYESFLLDLETVATFYVNWMLRVQISNDLVESLARELDKLAPELEKEMNRNQEILRTTDKVLRTARLDVEIQAQNGPLSTAYFSTKNCAGVAIGLKARTIALSKSTEYSAHKQLGEMLKGAAKGTSESKYLEFIEADIKAAIPDWVRFVDAALSRHQAAQRELERLGKPVVDEKIFENVADFKGLKYVDLVEPIMTMKNRMGKEIERRR